ncbi:MAG: AmpG family muropeptide MFS transporter [Alphaproteobacteria bacterium]|nr:AmpG family muropeptide MFS transporter [Alphaproteobacteria bacterium]
MCVNSWLKALAVYWDRRILAVLFLGFSSGLPLALTGQTLMAWLTEAQADLTTIGLFALVGVPYSVKFLWAPLIDRLSLPILSRLGRRRGWGLFVQASLAALLVLLGGIDPASQPGAFAAIAVLIAFASASQDIVIDAFRVEILEEKQYGAGAAAVQFGYRIGMLISGAGSLFLAEAMPWPQVYAVMAGLMGVGALTLLLNKEPKEVPAPASGNWLRDKVLAPFADIVSRLGWQVLAVFAFIVLYKLGDALAGMISTTFYLKMGFAKSEIAEISKLFGFGATILGTFLGGVGVARFGIGKSLIVFGVFQMGSNLMFAWMATRGHDIPALYATIGIENLAGGMGSAAFVAYLSRLCNLSFTGTQYALLSSPAALGRTLFASSSGWLVVQLGWVNFFALSTVAALPGLLLLFWMLKRFPATTR